MLLVDVVDNEGTVPPAQILSEVPNVNAGVMLGATVTVNIVAVAHNPAVGVNVYVAEFWLSTIEGLQVPVIAFVDVVGNAGTTPPAHIVSDVPNANTGFMFALTVTVIVTGTAHTPIAGVNVYVPEF
jgi:hypothetical protein